MDKIGDIQRAYFLPRYYEKPLISALKRGLLGPVARQIKGDVASARIE